MIVFDDVDKRFTLIAFSTFILSMNLIDWFYTGFIVLCVARIVGLFRTINVMLLVTF